MLRALPAIILALILGLAVGARAQTAGSGPPSPAATIAPTPAAPAAGVGPAEPSATARGVRSKLYIFGDHVFDGGVHRPELSLLGARERVRFERLLDLKKSFVRPLLETAKLSVFR